MRPWEVINDPPTLHALDAVDEAANQTFVDLVVVFDTSLGRSRRSRIFVFGLIGSSRPCSAWRLLVAEQSRELADYSGAVNARSGRSSGMRLGGIGRRRR